jgi:hypothetical protein
VLKAVFKRISSKLLNAKPLAWGIFQRVGGRKGVRRMTYIIVLRFYGPRCIVNPNSQVVS